MFNPTKISIHPSYFVWKALTQTSNHCRSSLSDATCTPPESFLPLLLNKRKSALAPTAVLWFGNTHCHYCLLHFCNGLVSMFASSTLTRAHDSNTVSSPGEPGVIKMGTAGTDGRRHISKTTFLQAHFVKINFIILVLLCILLSVTISLLKSLLIGTLTS
jgi:hypothetical protein